MTRTFPRFLSRQVARLIPVKSLLKIPTPVFLPFYHVVSNEDLPHILNYNYRNVEQFERELDFYLKHFHPVTLDEVLKPVASTRKPFHISFDDGLKECAEVIAPLLIKKGIPATFFINPAFIDNKALFHKYKASLVCRNIRKSGNRHAEELLRKNGLSGNSILKASIFQVDLIDRVAQMLEIGFQDFLEKQKPYLTTNHLIDLQKKGFTIGAHSNHHAEFWQITENQQKEEITASMNWVINQINPGVNAFAFPFTDSGVSKHLLEAIQKENICDITFGTAGIKSDELHYHFQRYPVENSNDFIGDLKSELVYFQFRKLVGKEIVTH